jgi:hypothetical protein
MSETTPRHATDITTHPDAAEMRARFERVVESPRASMLDGLVILLGLYMAASPWIVHFHLTNPDVAVNNLLVGLVLAAFGMGLALLPERMYRLGWICIPIGVWMIISPWVVSIGHSATSHVIWNNVATGAVAVVIGLMLQGMTASALRARR